MARNQYIQLPENQNLQIKSLTPKCATVRCFAGGILWGSPYRLDILTRIFGRIFKQNLCSLCGPWIISCLRQDVLE